MQEKRCERLTVPGSGRGKAEFSFLLVSYFYVSRGGSRLVGHVGLLVARLYRCAHLAGAQVARCYKGGRRCSADRHSPVRQRRFATWTRSPLGSLVFFRLSRSSSACVARVSEFFLGYFDRSFDHSSRLVAFCCCFH